MKKTIVLICISLLLFALWGCSSAPDKKDETADNEITNTDTSSTGLQHGEKDEKGRVYIDTSIVDIDNTRDGDTFLRLFEEYYGGFESGKSYFFVTDKNEYILKETTYGFDVCIRPNECDTTFTEEYMEYDFNHNYIGRVVQSYEDGHLRYVLTEKDGFVTERKLPGNGTIIYTEATNGVVTFAESQRSVDGHVYYDYYKNDKKEITLTYDASGTGLVGYKYVDLRDGSVYDWVLDGNGNETDNILSVTITENGWTTTYTGRNEIPWGAAIAYPPHVAGLYE